MSDVRRVRRRLGDVVGGAASEEERPQEVRRRRMKPLERRRRKRRADAAERSLRVLMRGRSRLGEGVPGRRKRRSGKGAGGEFVEYYEGMDTVISEGALMLRDVVRARRWLGVKQLGPSLGGGGTGKRLWTVGKNFGGKVKRRALRMEPYNPKAVSGDGDPYVQEGTPWERPANTIITGPDGNELEEGFTFDLDDLDDGKVKLTTFRISNPDGSRYMGQAIDKDGKPLVDSEGKPVQVEAPTFSSFDDTPENRKLLEELEKGKQVVRYNVVPEAARPYDEKRRGELKRLFGRYRGKGGEKEPLNEEQVRKLVEEGKLSQEEFDYRAAVLAMIDDPEFLNWVSRLKVPPRLQEDAEDIRQNLLTALRNRWYNFQTDGSYYGEGDDLISSDSPESGLRAWTNTVARSVFSQEVARRQKERVGGSEGDVGARAVARGFDDIDSDSGDEGDDFLDRGDDGVGDDPEFDAAVGRGARAARSGSVTNRHTAEAIREIEDGIDLNDPEAVLKSDTAKEYVDFMESVAPGFKEFWENDNAWVQRGEGGKELADHRRMLWLRTQVFSSNAVFRETGKRETSEAIMNALVEKDSKYASGPFKVNPDVISGLVNKTYKNKIWPLIVEDLRKRQGKSFDAAELGAYIKAARSKSAWLAWLEAEVGLSSERVAEIEEALKGTGKTVKTLSGLRTERLAARNQHWTEWLRTKASVAKRAVNAAKKKL